MSVGILDDETQLTVLAVWRQCNVCEGFLDAVVPDSDLEDLPRLLARRYLAFEQIGHLHHLLDLFHRGHAHALSAPHVVLDANPAVDPKSDGHGSIGRHSSPQGLDRRSRAVWRSS